jgi:hypothetical protein
MWVIYKLKKYLVEYYNSIHIIFKIIYINTILNFNRVGICHYTIKIFMNFRK